MEMDSGIAGPPLESRRDEGAATATATGTATAPELPTQPDSDEPKIARTRGARKTTQDQSFLV